MAKECATYIYSMLEADVKQGSDSVAVWAVYRVFVAGRNVRNWALLNPAEPHWAVGHLFSANARELLHLTITPYTRIPPPSAPPPKCWNLFPQGFDSSYHNSMDPLSWIIPILCSDWWVPAGHDCRHRWEFRPAMASICHIALLSRCSCFSFHLSSLSLFCSRKTTRAGRERWAPSRLRKVKLDAH